MAAISANSHLSSTHGHLGSYGSGLFYAAADAMPTLHTPDQRMCNIFCMIT
jgi:hypothetical protein